VHAQEVLRKLYIFDWFDSTTKLRRNQRVRDKTTSLVLYSRRNNNGRRLRAHLDYLLCLAIRPITTKSFVEAQKPLVHVVVLDR
jgi:hypothetical protein